MKNTTENLLREKQLQSHGRLLSGFSHDLKNHLAIINESKGLLQDYIEMGMITDEELSGKLGGILVQLDRRIGMITKMAQHLNSFGHRFDTPSSTFDLNELLNEQLFFLQRSAKLKQISLTTAIPESKVSVNSYPSLLQFIFLQLFDTALNRLHENDRMTISTKQQNGDAAIHLSLKSKSPPSTAADSALNTPEIKLCMEKIGARIAIDSMDRHCQEMVVTLPMAHTS